MWSKLFKFMIIITRGEERFRSIGEILNIFKEIAHHMILGRVIAKWLYREKGGVDGLCREGGGDYD